MPEIINKRVTDSTHSKLSEAPKGQNVRLRKEIENRKSV